MRILIVLCLLLCAGCASQNALLARQDYQPSQEAFLRGDDDAALRDFPDSHEAGDFITTEEKTYLALIQGKPEIGALQRQESLQRQLRLQQKYLSARLLRHTHILFNARTPQDYFPAPHEQIWLHMLLAWGYADQGKYTDAAMEARLARQLLSLPSTAREHFDDPMLRLLLAGLWTMCGQWPEARTDLHAAWVLDNRLGWAKVLAERERAPTQLFIVMGGSGPDITWHPSLGLNPLRAARRVKYILRGRRSALTIQDARGLEIITHLSPDARHWYDYAPMREGELTALLQDVSYGGKATENGIVASVDFAGDTLKDAGVGAAGGGVGGVAVLVFAPFFGGSSANTSPAGNGASTPTTVDGGYYTAANARKAATVGIAVGGVVGVGYGAVEGYHAATARFKTAMDPTPRYRYVRYLPEYLWLGWSDQPPVTFPVTLRTPRQVAVIPAPTVVNGTAVTLAHLVDTNESLCKYSSDHGAATILGFPDASGHCPPQPNL